MDVLACILYSVPRVGLIRPSWSAVQVRFGSDSVRCELGLVRSGSVRFGPIRFGSVWFDSVRLGSIRFGSVRFGSVRFGSVRFGSGRFNSVRFCAPIIFPSRFGSESLPRSYSG